MRPTDHMLRLIRDDVAARPLAAGEHRRLVGLGAHYVARSDAAEDGRPPNLTRLLSLEINGIRYDLFHAAE